MIISQILQQKHSKEELIAKIIMIPNYFDELINLSLCSNNINWRALWMIQHTIHYNNHQTKFLKYFDNYSNLIVHKKDGYQRIFMQIILELHLTETQQIIIFDHCLKIWQNIHKSSGLRFVALKFLIQQTKIFPELKNEIALYTAPYYLEKLTPGIKKITFNLLKKMNMI